MVLSLSLACFPVSSSSLASLTLLEDDAQSRTFTSPAKQAAPAVDREFAGTIKTLPQVDSFISNGVSDDVILQPQLLRGKVELILCANGFFLLA